MTSLERAFEEIGLYAEHRMREVNMPGMALAVTDREKLVRVATFGYADLASGRQVQPGTMFEIGSIGKSFTNVALLQLRDEGRLDLQAPVSRYLAWFEVQSGYGPITTHHLMTHTAGLPSGTDIGPHGLYEAWALRESRTGAPPGEYFRYSNVGYKTLGFLLEELDGRSYRESIQTRVLDPLSMGDSHPVIGYETRKRAAVGYRSFYDDRPEHVSHGLAPALWTEYGVGDGCQASTAGDMATYLRMLMNRGSGAAGRLMSWESFRLMTHRAIATQQWGGAHYGYGLTMAEVDGHAYLGHGGSTTGFVAGMIADLEDGIGVVVLVNGYVQSYGAVDMAMHMLKLLRVGLRGEEMPPTPVVANPQSISNAADYAGTYSAGEDRLTVTAQGEGLSLQWRGLDVGLQRRGVDSFYLPHPDLERHLLEFGRDGERVVEVLHGPDWYVGEEYSGPASFDYPVEWEGFTGHYRAYNFGLTNFRIVLRKGSLLLVYPSGGHEPLVPLGEGLFRIGEDLRSPETIRFDAVASGRALRVTCSGCPYYRTYTP
jgi:CubicO group peptidase (beta-lactamase class C family)